jgi:sarcosine oxidase
VMYWFEPTGGIGPFLPECFPIFIWEPDDDNMFYSFSAQDDDRGVKAASFRAGGYPCDPETIDREVRKEETEFIRGYLAEHVHELAGRCLDAPARTPTTRTCTSSSLRTRS